MDISSIALTLSLISGYFDDKAEYEKPGDVYRQWAETAREAARRIEAIRTQEPRVLAVDELQECKTYWIEDENGHVVPETILDISGKDIMTIPVVHLTNGYAPIITKSTDGYGSKYFTGWRCWTERPTKEQMEAEPWREDIPDDH